MVTLAGRLEVRAGRGKIMSRVAPTLTLSDKEKKKNRERKLVYN